MAKTLSLVLAISITVLSSLALTTDALARGGHGGHHGGHGHRVGHHGHHGAHHGGHRHWHGGHRNWHGGRGYRAGWYGGPRYGVHRCRAFARFPTYPYRRCVRYW
jgi:hypothetical protein